LESQRHAAVPGPCSLDYTDALEKRFMMKELDRRVSVAPMMDYTDARRFS
jgi:hypothetical protein